MVCLRWLWFTIVALVVGLVLAVVWLIVIATPDETDEAAAGTPTATADATVPPSATRPPEAEAVFEYFRDLQDVRRRATELGNDILSTPRPTLGPNASLDDYRETIVGGIRLTVPVFQSLVDGMEQIDPPPPVAQIHQEWLSAYRQVVGSSEGIIDIIEVVSTWAASPPHRFRTSPRMIPSEKALRLSRCCVVLETRPYLQK